MPEGSFVVQSTTYHTWPYPALLYKKGTWAAVDLFFMLNDIPMTFIGELGIIIIRLVNVSHAIYILDGHAFKVKTTNIFSHVRIEDQTEDNSTLSTIRENEDDGMT